MLAGRPNAYMATYAELHTCPPMLSNVRTLQDCADSTPEAAIRIPALCEAFNTVCSGLRAPVDTRLLSAGCSTRVTRQLQCRMALTYSATRVGMMFEGSTAIGR